MPLYDTTPSSATPCTSPLCSRTTGGVFCATVQKPIAASAIRKYNSSFTTLESLPMLLPLFRRISMNAFFFLGRDDPSSCGISREQLAIYHPL
jgi:hypothetical protein